LNSIKENHRRSISKNKNMNKNIILNNQDIEHKIKRIAYQIYETFVEEPEIVIAGIASNGFVLAQKIAVVLENIAPIKVILCEVNIDKNNPTTPVTTSIAKEAYKNKGLVLVDDVLSSGTTLIYGVKHFLDTPLKKMKTAVLVDRNHKKYPIKADFKGISLSTSLLEHVQVVFEENQDHAYLS
jgi:pyrimidine operon attenuation protein/uracil phosphoribosyltransferase